MDSAGASLRAGRAIEDRRETASVGRRARLELVFGLRGGRTILRHAYAEPPLRAGRPFADGDGVHLILASSAPGLFGGDVFTQQIVVEAGARVRLTSQSALQVHPSPDAEPAHLCSTYTVEEDATLRCEWDPLIPFAGAAVQQRLHVRLAERAALYWSDAIMSGREGSGEAWAFKTLSHELEVTRGPSLEYLERYDVSPAMWPARSAVVGDAAYFGTIVRSGPAAGAGQAASLQAELARIDGVRGAADCLDAHLFLVRLMGASGPAFREARALSAAMLTGGLRA